MKIKWKRISTKWNWTGRNGRFPTAIKTFNWLEAEHTDRFGKKRIVVCSWSGFREWEEGFLLAVYVSYLPICEKKKTKFICSDSTVLGLFLFLKTQEFVIWQGDLKNNTASVVCFFFPRISWNHKHFGRLSGNYDQLVKLLCYITDIK